MNHQHAILIVEPASRYRSAFEALLEAGGPAASVVRLVHESELDDIAGSRTLSVIIYRDEASVPETRALVVEASRLAAVATNKGLRPKVFQVEGLPDLAGVLSLIENDPAHQTAVWDALPLGPLLSFYDGADFNPARAVRWGPETFIYDEKASGDQGEVGSLRIAGRPRYLSHGPYLWLPSGTWRIKLELWIDAAAAERRLRVEWGGIQSFEQCTFKLDQPGRYMVELDHRWQDVEPAELRIVLVESALDGKVDLKYAMVSWVN